jgi:tRNA A-37 threonylcarbamoyl transferase component Bud32
MKSFMKYFLMIFLCTDLSLSLTDQEITEFYKVYESKKSNLEGLLKNIPIEVFQELNKSTLMQRITDYEGWLGVGSGGIAIKATYHPLSGNPFVASIKILPDNEGYRCFQSNLILAYLTGDVMTDKYNSRRERVFSYKMSESRAEINIDPEHRNPHAANINPFYEMQKVSAEFKKTESSDVVKYHFTIMVTGIGTRNLEGKLFKKDSDKNVNTAHLLNYWLDIARAGFNVNAQGVLHGDIKPANMILVPNEGDYKVEFIDFDLALRPQPQFNFDKQLRYTEGFRAPWIQPRLVLVKHNTQSEAVFEIMYPYSRNFTEDSFAIVQSMKAIFQSNLNLVNENDVSIRKIANALEQQVIREAYSGYKYVLTTEVVYKFVKSVIENRKKDLIEEINYLKQLLKRRMVDASENDLASQVKKMSVVSPIPKNDRKLKVTSSPQLKHQPFQDNSAYRVLDQAHLPKGEKKRIIV